MRAVDRRVEPKVRAGRTRRIGALVEHHPRAIGHASFDQLFDLVCELRSLSTLVRGDIAHMTKNHGGVIGFNCGIAQQRPFPALPRRAQLGGINLAGEVIESVSLREHRAALGCRERIPLECSLRRAIVRLGLDSDALQALDRRVPSAGNHVMRARRLLPDPAQHVVRRGEVQLDAARLQHRSQSSLRPLSMTSSMQDDAPSTAALMSSKNACSSVSCRAAAEPSVRFVLRSSSMSRSCSSSIVGHAVWRDVQTFATPSDADPRHSAAERSAPTQSRQATAARASRATF
jgi:hypothetical protein